jgi:hypothetical protein
MKTIAHEPCPSKSKIKAERDIDAVIAYCLGEYLRVPLEELVGFAADGCMEEIEAPSDDEVAREARVVRIKGLLVAIVDDLLAELVQAALEGEVQS